ncbi:NUDIX hydrolase [TM7 phylum sp. oral taxon 352]|nr:NUDIX hydrolase [TM7 phylum sp. oral taxon 352]TWP15064.1 NUDIX hydrolase [TM7 phylum sp. oral taxon 352]TWP16622.1 NUDIX hydrolase [TM7 phylum sp. oral taxon 352]TWP18363.1 NUDIX hydrolase [TM7 phylum sp. oral taxon 352]TWP18873.1 NUDIX hydrolase [TM7 phylum sp. oral taxon 352]
MSHKRSIVGEIFSSFVRAIFRGVAYVMSLALRIGSKKDRVRVIVYRDDGDILLVKNRFSRQKWALPGGGVKHNESYEQAAVREVLEEIGLKIHNLQYLGKANSHESYAKFSVRVFAAHAYDCDIKCNFEIMEARWFNRDYIPKEYCALYANKCQ